MRQQSLLGEIFQRQIYIALSLIKRNPSRTILRGIVFILWICLVFLCYICTTGPLQKPRQARFGPCLDFGFQYTLTRNNQSKKFGVEYWTVGALGSLLSWTGFTQGYRNYSLGFYPVTIIKVLARTVLYCNSENWRSAPSSMYLSS